jgi:hypothetical protein
MRLASLAVAAALAAPGGCGKQRDAEPSAPAAGGDGAPSEVHAAAPAQPGGHDMLDRAPFVLQLSYVEAEHSRDSNSTVVHATVIGDQLFYVLTPEGGHADRRAGWALEGVTLGAGELAALRQSILDKNLLTAKTIQAADAPAPSFTVRADLNLRVDAQRNHLTVSGALRSQGRETALAATDAYRGVSALAGELRQLAERKRTP